MKARSIRFASLATGFICFSLVSAASAITITVSNLAPGGPGSLADAINTANASPGPDAIEFAVGGIIILPADLPPLVDNDTEIRGETAPGPCPGIMLRSFGAATGIRIVGASGCVIRAISINHFDTGIDVFAGANNNRIGEPGACPLELWGNTRGLRIRDVGSDQNRVSNVLAHVNGGNGIEILTGPIGTQVGGGPADRCVIHSNGGHGILVQATGAPVFDTMIADNLIGTDGLGLLGNGQDGVQVAGGERTTILRNVIGNNNGHGVALRGDSRDNTVEQNHIGVDGSGMVPMPNALNGVALIDETDTNRILDNQISGNIQNGVYAEGSSVFMNEIRSNTIGLDASLAAPIPNRFHGVNLADGTRQNVVAGNVISGNERNGVRLGGNDPELNQIVGNTIGLDATGAVAVPNLWNGVALTPVSSDNVVDGNVISGNKLYGVAIAGVASDANTVTSNRIGTNAAGTGAVPNERGGVFVESSFNRIGGGAAQGNIVSGNQGWGIVCDNTSGIIQTGNRIQGNRVGVDAAGNPMGNTAGGVWVASGFRVNLIGEVSGGVGSGNVIQHNAGPGVLVGGGLGPVPYENRILTNSIGDNALDGIQLQLGGNDLIAAPSVTAATSTTVWGSTNVLCSTTVQIFYDSADEGSVYVGEVSVAGPAFTLGGLSLPMGVNVTATNTSVCPVPRPTEHTSPFSVPVAVSPAAVNDEPVTTGAPRLALLGANPFRDVLHLSVTTPTPTDLSVRVLDVRGRLVQTLHDAPVSVGTLELAWNGEAESGRPAASGVYLLSATFGAVREVRRVTYLR